MKKLLPVLIFLLLAAGFAAAEEDEYRLKYSEAFSRMQEFQKNLYLKEAVERSGHFGLGVSGNFIFDVDWTTIRQSELRQGFVSLSANYWFYLLFNAYVEGGLHRSTSREVWTFSTMLQFMGPGGQLERNPGGVGLEAGFKSYFSNIPGESVTCFKLGVCGYQFLTKNLTTELSFDWITPAFLGNSFELNGGLKYFFF